MAHLKFPLSKNPWQPYLTAHTNLARVWPMINTLCLALAFLIAFVPAFSDDDLPSQMRIGAEYQPLGSAYDCVNLITGDFFLTDSSLVIDGPAPLSCTRIYDSGLDYHNHHWRKTWNLWRAGLENHSEMVQSFEKH